MEENLKIALIQVPLLWESPEANREVFSKKIESLSKDVDVIILPEMFTSGFTMCPDNISPFEDEATLVWMQGVSQSSNAAIVGSIVYRVGTKNFNRLLFVKPDGSISAYDKRHTFTLVGEDEKYTAGTQQLLVHYKGFVVCPLICYDLRFPVWSRNTMEYELFLIQI